MTNLKTKAMLTPARKRLIKLMQKINFGQIDGLAVQDGEPVFDPHPRVIRDVKLGSQTGPRPESDLEDFVLKDEVIELFSQLDSFINSTTIFIEVKHGLPFRIQWEVVAA